MDDYPETQRRILEVGKQEFLEKGFKDASLRGIVKKAGFTQGAFYATIPTRRRCSRRSSLLRRRTSLSSSRWLNRLITI